MIGLFNAGWYSILKSKLYDALGDRSGSVLVVGNIAGIFGALLPFFLGLIAESYGLSTAMWLLLVSPIALAITLPKAT